MAEPPPPPPAPPPQPPAADVGFKGKGTKVAWVPKPPLKHEGSSIPIPIPSPIPIPIRTPPPPDGYRPYGYGAGPNSFGIRPYGYGYHQCVRPVLQPQPWPQVVAMNGFVGNRGKSKVVDVVQRQTTLFGLVRRGTGVFHPPPVHNRPNTTTNKGWRHRRAESTCQIRRSNNASKENDDDCSVKLEEECHEQTPSSEIGLPQEWTYEPNIL